MGAKQGTVYYFETDYTYNVFGADEHLRVTLWRDRGKKTMKAVGTWTYSTFLMEGLANARAERRIRKLRDTYGARPL